MELELTGIIQDYNNKEFNKNSKYIWLTITESNDICKINNIINTYNSGNTKYSFSFYKDYPNMKLKINIPKKNKEHNILNYTSLNLINIPLNVWCKYYVKVRVKLYKKTFKKFNNNSVEIYNTAFFNIIKIML